MTKDRLHFIERVAPFFRWLVINHNFNRVEARGIEYIKQDGYRKLYASGHLSLLDPPVSGWVLWLNNIPVPYFATGVNLLKIPALGYVLRKIGGYPIRRGRDYVSKEIDHTARLLNEGDVLYYPGYTMKNGKRKTGRSWNGMHQTFTPSFVEAAMRVYDNGKEVHFVPLSVSYTRVPEERMLLLSEKYPFLKSIELPYTFLLPLFMKKEIDVYACFGKPHSISELVRELPDGSGSNLRRSNLCRNIARFLEQEVRRLYIVMPTDAWSAAIKRLGDGREFEDSRIIDQVGQLCEELYGELDFSLINLDTVKDKVEEYAHDIFEFRDGKTRVRNPYLLEYHANRLNI